MQTLEYNQKHFHHGTKQVRKTSPGSHTCTIQSKNTSAMAQNKLEKQVPEAIPVPYNPKTLPPWHKSS